MLQVAGAGSGQYNFLNVSGNANLGGTLQLTNLGYKPKAGDQLTLVAAGKIVSGQFGHFIDPFSTGSGYNTVDLSISRSLFSNVDAFFGIQNVADTVYYVQTNPSTVGTPRLINGGIRVKWTGR